MTTESFIERAQALIDSAVEYETTHIDAGDNYSHLASEGDLINIYGDNLLQGYCDDAGFDTTGIEIDRLAEDVIFWSYMVQGSDFDCYNRFLVASYGVGEIEIQVDSSDIGARFTPYLIKQLNKRTDGYWSYSSKDIAYCYINCQGNYWDKVCDPAVIQDLINQHKESI